MAQEQQEDFTQSLPEPAAPIPDIQDDGAVEQIPSIRDSLEKGFEDARQEQPEKRARTDKGKTRAAKTPAPREDAQEIKEQWKETGKQPATAAPKTDQALGTAEQTTAAPKAWTKEAQAEWNNLPPAIQAAVSKRENDIANGVAQLRQRYSDIDTAIQPHLQAINQNGFTPGQAVGQLFQWFQALANDPINAFPALAQSFGWDLNRLVTAYQASYDQQQQAQQAQTAQLEQLPPQFRQVLDQIPAIVQRQNQFEEYQRLQNEAATQRVIEEWSRDKPYFDQVRMMMGQAIASGMCPPKNEKVDLDGAYAMACRAHPDIWQRLTAAQQAAFTQAQNQATQRQRTADQTAANKARKTASSISSSAPGLNNSMGKTGERKPGRTVREDLIAAAQEVNSQA